MKQQFREFHLLNILNSDNFLTLPIDLHLKKYFHSHKAIGSKDRKFISETIYALIKWFGLIDYLTHSSSPSWKKRYEALFNSNPLNYLENQTIPLHTRLSMPYFLFQLFLKHYGESETIRFALLFNEQAPTTIRINPLKTSRETLFNSWKDIFSISMTSHSKWGINFQKKINFSALQEFKNGLFEVQDEASQLVAELVEVKPGDLVLDYCAGAGGKTLAFAHKMQQKGQIYLHDIRASSLEEAKKRLRRAGIQNAQILPYDSPYKSQLKEKIHWILLDMPCSGSGTLRRNPDIKWKINQEMIERLVLEQQKIFEEAIKFLHPKGRIVYATCSMLPEENQQQILYFQKNFNLIQEGEPFQSFPVKEGMDGFFASVLRRSTTC